MSRPERAHRSPAELKRGFLIHLAVFAAVNSGLGALNLMRQPDRLWFIWPLAGWGLGIILHAVLAFRSHPDDVSNRAANP